MELLGVEPTYSTNASISPLDMPAYYLPIASKLKLLDTPRPTPLYSPTPHRAATPSALTPGSPQGLPNLYCPGAPVATLDYKGLHDRKSLGTDMIWGCHSI